LRPRTTIRARTGSRKHRNFLDEVRPILSQAHLILYPQ
jgi:hypothetical protein